MEFRNKIKEAGNYKRAFNPIGSFSLNIFPNRTWGRVGKVVFLGLVLVLFYFMTVSDSLSVTKISISGNRQVSTQQIQGILDTLSDSRLFLVKKNNFFLMSEGRVNQVLSEYLPTVKGITKFERVWPNEVKIEISEHIPGFVIESNQNYFLVDEEGTVVNEVDDPKKLLIAHDQVVESFARNEILPNTKLAPFIISMSKSWSTKVSTTLTSVRFPGKSSREAQFVTEAGWSVLFDTSRPVSVQITDLAVILNKQISIADQSRLAYVDLRLSKWAYYCFKASPCEQHEQPTEAGVETHVEQ